MTAIFHQPATEDEPDTKCPYCKKREGTIKWSEGPIAAVYGMWSMVCEVCAYEQQLEHARERAAAIPELECKLAEAKERLDP